uniref:Uncharacterized protein n=1 Tax=Cacopsylla melanoneura TaxID=428564 RepID=A0A8D8Z5I5_9HEMI
MLSCHLYVQCHLYLQEQNSFCFKRWFCVILGFFRIIFQSSVQRFKTGIFKTLQSCNSLFIVLWGYIFAINVSFFYYTSREISSPGMFFAWSSWSPSMLMVTAAMLMLLPVSSTSVSSVMPLSPSMFPR